MTANTTNTAPLLTPSAAAVGKRSKRSGEWVVALEPRRLLSAAPPLHHSVLTLPTPARDDVAATAVGHRLLLAGGSFVLGGGAGSDLVNVYDTSTNRWDKPVRLSQARTQIAASAVGHVAVFAGGRVTQTGLSSDVVDIYSARSARWSTTTLPKPCTAMRGLAADHRAIFYGGFTATGDGLGSSENGAIFLFDLRTGQWTTSPLGVDASAGVGVVGDTLIFADGTYDLETGRWALSPIPADVHLVPDSVVTSGPQVIFYGNTIALGYDVMTGHWSTHALPGGHQEPVIFSAGTKAVFAGSLDIIPATPPSVPSISLTGQTEVYDVVTGTWATTTLSADNLYTNRAAVLGIKAVIAPSRLVYDASTGDAFTVEQAISAVDGVVTVGRRAFFSGDAFGSDPKLIDVYRDPSPAPSLVGGVGTISGDFSRPQQVAVLLQNNGDAAYLGPFRISVFASTTRDPSVAGQPIGQLAVSRSIRPGQTFQLSVPVTIGRNLTPGDYFLVADVERRGHHTSFGSSTETVHVNVSPHAPTVLPAAPGPARHRPPNQTFTIHPKPTPANPSIARPHPFATAPAPLHAWPLGGDQR
jgi:hypothetical protein